MKIRKRNGMLVDFDANKIKNAIKKAMDEVGLLDEDYLNIVTTVVTQQCYDDITVEDIQDLVVTTLLGLGLHKIAIAYISYRAVQEHKRSISLQKIFDKMGDIIDFGDNENSNKDYKLSSVIRDTIAGEYFRGNLEKSIGKELYDAHRIGLVHWHK